MAGPSKTITITANLSDLSQTATVNGITVSKAQVIGTAILTGPKGDTGATGPAGPAGTTDYNALTNKPALATVATTGSYNDLTNKPTSINSSVTRTDQRGTSLAGLEFAPQILPGVANTDYAIPMEADFQYFAGKGLQLIRIPFLWERLQPTLNGALDTAYLGYLDLAVTYARKYNQRIILDCHNYGRYRVSGTDQVIGGGTVTVAHFVNLWTRLSTYYKDEPTVFMYDLMNEPHDMPVPLSPSTYLQQTLGTTNLVSNPGFESGATGWNNFGTDFSLDTTPADARTGNNCVKQVSTSGYDSFFSNGITVATNTTYTLSIYSKISASNPTIQVLTGSGFGAILAASNLSPSASYTKQSVTFNSGANTTIYVGIKNNGAAVTAYYDDFELVTGGPTATVTEMYNAAITAIRNNDKNTWIALETDGYAGIQNFTNQFGSNPSIWWNDQVNKTMISFHYYQDVDHSGTYTQPWETSVRTRIPTEILPALKWANTKNVPVFAGEFGVPGGNANWLTDLDTLMSYFDEYRVYATQWGSGSWYTSPSTMQPTGNYTVDNGQLAIIQKHLSFSPTVAAQQTGLDAKITGPSSATNNNLVSFDGTTGKLVADSGINATTLSNQISDLYNSKQNTLVSGTNIKTVNGNSLLGSGDLVISGGGSGSAATTTFSPTGNVEATNVQAAIAEVDSEKLKNTTDSLRGDLTIRNTGSTLTKDYRFRTSGGSLDTEAAGADWIWSMFQNPDFTGTQYNWMTVSAIGNVSFPMGHTSTGRVGVGGLVVGVAKPTANYVVADGIYLVLANGSSAAVEVKLPSAFSNNGRLITVKSVNSANTVKVNTNGGDIDGTAEIILGTNDWIQVIADSNGMWRIVSRNRTSSSATLTSATTLTTTSSSNQLANASTGAFNATLPSTTIAGYEFLIKKIDASANAVTVVGTIDGATNYVLSTQNKYVRVISTTTSGVWYVVGNN